jgi:hypothetical protein
VKKTVMVYINSLSRVADYYAILVVITTGRSAMKGRDILETVKLA